MMWSASNPRNPVTSDTEDADAETSFCSSDSTLASSSPSLPLLPVGNKTSSFSVASFEGGGFPVPTFVIAQKKPLKVKGVERSTKERTINCSGEFLFETLNIFIKFWNRGEVCLFETNTRITPKLHQIHTVFIILHKNIFLCYIFRCVCLHTSKKK